MLCLFLPIGHCDDYKLLCFPRLCLYIPTAFAKVCVITEEKFTLHIFTFNVVNYSHNLSMFPMLYCNIVAYFQVPFRDRKSQDNMANIHQTAGDWTPVEYTWPENDVMIRCSRPVIEKMFSGQSCPVKSLCSTKVKALWIYSDTFACYVFYHIEITYLSFFNLPYEKYSYWIVTSNNTVKT